jgi:hypothetical protein
MTADLDGQLFKQTISKAIISQKRRQANRLLLLWFGKLIYNLQSKRKIKASFC